MEKSDRELLEAIHGEVVRIANQINPLNRPTFAGDVSEKLAAVVKRLEAIEELLQEKSN